MNPLEKDVLDLLLDDAEEIFKRRFLTDKEIARVWNAIESFYLYQILEQEGPFYDMTKNINKKITTIDE